jgi:hypothetical protein
MKRKLEDVSRKLEILYDKLREGSVSVYSGILRPVHPLLHYEKKLSPW